MNINAELEKSLLLLMGINIFNRNIKEIISTLDAYCLRMLVKERGKLNCETHLITPLKGHNHDVAEYKSEVYDLKTKCKTIAKNSQTNLRKVFDDTTRFIAPSHVKSRFLNVS